MKRIAMILWCATLVAAWARAAQIEVRLAPPPGGGAVELVLFDSADTFGDLRDPVRQERFPADGRTVFDLSDVPAGEYALMVHHDRNGNGRLDRNFIGIPREPVGFSNGYRPKGPPSYARAAFRVGAAETRTFEIQAGSPLGRRGRVGIGVGLIARSSPYREYDGSVAQAIPALTYIGNRFQLFGPGLQVGLLGAGDLALALRARYRIGVYEQDESPYLEGLGDRENTLMAGLAVTYDLPGGLDLGAEVMWDTLDRIGGGSARLELDRSFPLGRLRLSPQIGVNWLDADLADHDFGVPAAAARPDRPAYAPGESLSYEAGVHGYLEITRDWAAVLNLAVERLDDDVKGSPIVDQRTVTKGFFALTYVL